MSFDVFKRDLPGYGLKVAAQYFGLAAENRTYIEGSDLEQMWQTDPEQLLAYALDDVMETERLARHLRTRHRPYARDGPTGASGRSHHLLCHRQQPPFFRSDDFQRVLAPNDLFGFSPAGIEVLTTERTAS